MKTFISIFFLLGVTSCSLIYSYTYPIEVIVHDGIYTRSILESEGRWVVTKQFASETFSFILQKSKDSDQSFNTTQPFSLITSSSVYNVKLSRSIVNLGQYSTITISNKMGQNVEHQSKSRVFISVLFVYKGVSRIYDVEIAINDLSSNK